MLNQNKNPAKGETIDHIAKNLDTTIFALPGKNYVCCILSGIRLISLVLYVKSASLFPAPHT